MNDRFISVTNAYFKNEILTAVTPSKYVVSVYGWDTANNVPALPGAFDIFVY